MALLTVAAAPAGAHAAPAPAAGGCDGFRAHRSSAPIVAYDARPDAPRVFAIQFKQELRNVVSYASFATKIDCMLRIYVLPHLARGRPNVVAFNEDIGLMTIATGSRGALARGLFGQPGGPSCESQGVPCATLGALGAVSVGYAQQIAAYHLRFPGLATVSQAFVGATDTLVRSFMQTFSTLSKRYGIYMLGSTDVAPFAQSSDAGDVALFADPDLPRPPSVYVATSPDVYNELFMWGPHDVRGDGPDVLRNVVATNRKVPLTPIEQQLQFTPGPSSGPEAVANLAPYALPGTAARIGFAISLPAFTYGAPPAGVDPCSDVSLYYMRCLDRLGANVVIQAEANPGRWTGADGDGIEKWQPMSWMESTYRAVSDASVHFDYNVTPMMVGNLADLPFDGQTAITQRGLAGAGCHYVGNVAFVPGEDRPDTRVYAGSQPGFVAIAPWVAPDAGRDALRAIGARLAPGSGDALENDYLETVVIADLPVPVDSVRADCVSGFDAGPAPVAQGGVGRSSPSGCTRRRVALISVRRRGARVASVVVYVNGARVRTLRGDRTRVAVRLAGLRPGLVRVRVVVRTRSGVRYTRVRVLRTCMVRKP